MANAFDFQLKADDQVSQSIQNIDDAVKKLLPQLDNARTGLQLGGRQSSEGVDEISGRLGNLAKNARDGVQFVGDLVPPLKMVGGLTLGLGGLATVINTVKTGIQNYANAGYKIETSAKNIGATTHAYQELTGAMMENGSAREAAESSITGLYQRANDAVNQRDDGFAALMAQVGVKISKTKEGVADVVKLMDDLNKVMLKESPAKQAVIAQVGGFSPELLSFLRQSTDQVQRLKDQAQRDGLIFSDKDVQNALAFRTQLNQVSASYDGMLMKSQAWLGQSSFVKEQVSQISDLMKNGDRYSVAHFFSMGGNTDQDYDLLRRASKDEPFKKTLTAPEKARMNIGYLDDDLKKKLRGWYGPTDQAHQLQQDVKGLYVHPPAVVGAQTGPEPTLFPQLESKYKLPRGTLNNVYQAESAGGKHLYSPAGAEGPFQFMPATGQQYGLKDRSDRMDTSKSAEAAAHYLSDLLTQFGGDMKKTIAAYNWGPSRVSKLGLNYAPKETRDYLDRVMPGLPDFYDASNVDDPSHSTIEDTQSGSGDPTGNDNSQIKKNGKPANQPEQYSDWLLNPPSANEDTASNPSDKSSESISNNENVSINQPSHPAEPNINTPVTGTGTPAGAGMDMQKVTDVLSNVLKEHKSEIEVTLISGRTGERKKVSGSGGKVTTAMSLP